MLTDPEDTSAEEPGDAEHLQESGFRWHRLVGRRVRQLLTRASRTTEGLMVRPVWFESVRRSMRASPVHEIASPGRQEAEPEGDDLSTERPRETRSAGFPRPITSERFRDLDPNLLRSLERRLGNPLPPVRVFRGPETDRVLRSMHADAATEGDALFFRAGRFDPHGPRGVALLGHELHHVARAHQAEGARRPTRGAEEAEARAVERALRSTLSAGRPLVTVPATASTPNAGPPAAARPAAAPAARPGVPRAALAGRSFGDSEPNGSAMRLTESDLAVIKEEVYRDLRDRIRIEYERGA